MVDASEAAQKRCLNENTLDALGRGGLPLAQRDRAVAHLDSCDDCRETLALLGHGVGADDAPQRVPAGERVGRYTVLHEVGRGSMGVVYAAHDPELDRKVALKLVHHEILPQGSRDEAASRLLREAQALARLSHPGVITAFDTGCFDGQVFLAMEFVEGGTLGAWVRAEGRTLDEVLEAFLAAGRGLVAAHAAGLVHRDFKPDNVLIGVDGRARVTDFGLARLAGERGGGADEGGVRPLPASHGASTQTGVLVGTPAYMAPELFRGEPADARSDQFAFCVALYEALYGGRPFVSAHRWNGCLGMEGREGARSRVPSGVQRAIARGLSLRPEGRFPSMAALLAAIEEGRGAWRRRLVGLAGALALAALLAGGLVVQRRGLEASPCVGATERLAGAWDDARRAEVKAAFLKTGAPNALASFSATERLLDRYAESWAEQRVQACEATHVRGEQSGELLDLRMGCLGQRREGLRALTALLAGADGPAIERAISAAAALPSLDECASRAALTAPLRPPADPATRATIEAWRVELAEAEAELAAGRYGSSGDRARRVAEAASSLAYRPLEAEAFLAVALAHVRLEDAAGAEPALQRALRAAEASGHLAIAARVELSLAFVHGHMLRRHAQGHFWVDLAGATLERLGDAPRKTAIERLLLEGDLLADEGRVSEAAPAFERVLALQEAAFGPDHPSVAATLARLATASATLERFPEAFAFGRRSLEASERLLGPEHPALAIPLHSMGFLFYSSGRLAEGRPFLERALAIETRAFGADHPELVKTLIGLSNLSDEHASAIALLERAWAIQERAAGPSHPDSLLILKNLAISYGLLGQHQAQLAHAERALPIEEGLLGSEHPEVALTLLQIGQAHARLGQPARGLPYLERAFSVAEARPLTDSLAMGRVARMDTRRQLADALWQVGRERDRARTVALGGLSLAQGDGDEMAASRAALEAWLAGHRRP